MTFKPKFGLVALGAWILPNAAMASGSDVFEANTILLLTILVVAKWMGFLATKLKLPELVGELLAGVILGNMALMGMPYDFQGHFQGSGFLQYAAELGVIILLFQVGLESNLTDLLKVGRNSFLVAMVGVIAPVLLGFGVSVTLGLGEGIVAWFVGATLAATSVGITAKVLKEASLLKAPSSQVILGAAVIDDVIGIVLLAVLIGASTTGSVGALEIAVIIGKCLLFFAGSYLFGRTLMPRFIWFNDLNTSSGFWTAFALLMALGFAQLSALAGLAPIIGAFMAGLILEDVHMQTTRNKMSIHSMMELMKPLTDILLPIFFVGIGAQVKLETLADPKAVLIILILSGVAFLGKLIAGGVVTGTGYDRIGIGIGMIPRGEVGLIFASYALIHNIMSPASYSILVFVVLATTIGGPVLLRPRLKHFNRT